MRGSLLRKVSRLIHYFSHHPGDLNRYCAHNIFARCSPLDLELPWIAYGAIDFLDDYLNPQMNICEYGTGGSTIFFGRRAGTVYSIENDEAWYAAVAGKVETLALRNIDIVLKPFDPRNPIAFEESSYLKAIPDDIRIDVFFIDGAEEWIPTRPTCFTYVENLVPPGGIIVVDDSWRYPSIRSWHNAKHMQIFQSPGPCRLGVTTTDVYFY